MLQRVVPDSRRAPQDKDEVVWVEFNNVDGQQTLPSAREPRRREYYLETKGVDATLLGQGRALFLTCCPSIHTHAQAPCFCSWATSRACRSGGCKRVARLSRLSTLDRAPSSVPPLSAGHAQPRPLKVRSTEVPRHTSFSLRFPQISRLLRTHLFCALAFRLLPQDTLANFRPLLAYANARPASVSHLATRGRVGY